MEKKHKELLILQRANLVDSLNMRSGLYTQLLCRKVIDQRMVRKIKVKQRLKMVRKTKVKLRLENG